MILCEIWNCPSSFDWVRVYSKVLELQWCHLYVPVCSLCYLSNSSFCLPWWYSNTRRYTKAKPMCLSWSMIWVLTNDHNFDLEKKKLAFTWAYIIIIVIIPYVDMGWLYPTRFHLPWTSLVLSSHIQYATMKLLIIPVSKYKHIKGKRLMWMTSLSGFKMIQKVTISTLIPQK